MSEPNNKTGANSSQATDRIDGKPEAAGSFAPSYTQDQKLKDCLPCKISGVLGCAAVSGYAFYERARMDPIKFAGRRQGFLALGLLFLSAGLFRITH